MGQNKYNKSNYINNKKFIKNLEEAGRIHGKSKEEVKEETAIDEQFDIEPDEESEDDNSNFLRDVWDSLFEE